MTRAEVLRRRLVTQRLAGRPAASATDVVAELGAVQSQEWAHGFWSLGMRTAGLTYAEVAAEHDAGRFVRTHILRPTWHYVAADDVRWILELTAPRVQQLNRSIARREGLDAPMLERGSAVIGSALASSPHLTRSELADRLVAEGLPGTGIGLAYVIMNAELERQIVSGPLNGRGQPTYALMDDRVPGGGHRPVDPAAELWRRFVVGHGPTSVRDFARWSSLTLTTAKAAAEAIRAQLQAVEVDGVELWFAEGGPAPDADRVDDAWLLPLYDELVLSYPQLTFPTADRHPHRPGTDLFIGSVVVDGTNIGNWRRTVNGSSVTVETRLTPDASGSQRQAVDRAVHRLADFLGKTPVRVAEQ